MCADRTPPPCGTAPPPCGAAPTCAGRLPAETADVLAYLVAGIEQCNADVHTVQAAVDLMARGGRLLGDLRAVLSYDATLEPACAPAVRSLARAHRRPTTPGKLALALAEFAAVAAKRGDALVGLGDFDPAWIAEAEALAASLRRLPDQRRRGGRPAHAAITRRNRLVAVLLDRMKRVRAAARFVFRHSPEVARLAAPPSTPRRVRREEPAAPVET